jgi:hypothetical protein
LLSYEHGRYGPLMAVAVPVVRRAVLAVAAAVCVAVLLGFPAPGSARAADCSLSDLGYNGACGPQFEIPAWGDGAGWTKPSKYSTIQLADLTGNGVDELIARNDDGIEIWTFDTKLGQWRPAVDKNGNPEVLNDFRSPLPSESGPNWTQAAYYSTIQTVDLTGTGAHAIIARFPGGMRVFRYTPPAGSKSIDGGTWSSTAAGPFSDADGYTDPSLYLSIHTIDAGSGWPAMLLAQSKAGVVVYDWNGSGWVKQSPSPYGPYSADPALYLDLQWATVSVNGKTFPAVVERNPDGVLVQYLSGGKWVVAGPQPNPGPFADEDPSADCGFSDNEAVGHCFGSSPSYYETLRFASIDGQAGEEMLGRSSTGLRVWKLASDGSRWSRLPTLTDLGGSAFGKNPPAPGHWGSIRTGDIGPGTSTNVLALDGTGLQTWSYDATAGKWTKLTSTAPLSLAGTTWDTDPSYYSTIQVGDVTGSGHDAVIARGPFGIRTWFYDLHGNSGWTSYLPQDTSSYPQFSGGQAAAFAALTSQAKSHGAIPANASSVRDVWTAENAPSDSELSALQQSILGFAGCSGSTDGNPPYTACTPPAGTSGFSAADWTAVVNEVLAEIGLARDTGEFFAELDTLRQKTFIAQGAELDAIAGKLGLQAAAGTETKVSPDEIVATVLEIAGAIAGEIPVAGSVAGPALATAAALVGLLASDSPTLNSEFPARYADLKDKFATMITEIDKGLEVQSQEVRSNYNLLSLVSQLTTGQGPWSHPDTVGLESANDQGFALWVYKQLLPTIYARYKVDRCDLGGHGPQCSLSGAGPETIGGVPTFTTIGPPPTKGGIFGPPDTPCNRTDIFAGTRCQFQALPGPISTKVWGPLSNTCNYQPGNASTKWTFDCNLGVNKYSSTSLVDGTANGWDFPSFCFDYSSDADLHPCSGASGSAAVGADGRVMLTGTLPRGFNVKSASVDLPQLFDQGSSLPRLVSAGRGNEAAGPLPLSVHTGPGKATSAPGAAPSGQLSLTGRTARGQRFMLSVTGVSVGIPAACQQLPAATARTTPTVWLNSEFVVGNGSSSRRISVPSAWRCVRDRAGVVSELTPAPTRKVTQRSGLHVSLSLPRRAVRGRALRYRVRVSNRRRGRRNRSVSSLWHVQADAYVTVGRRRFVDAKVGLGAAELRRRRTRTASFGVDVPDSGRGRVCVAVTATAESARSATARRCAKIVNPPKGNLG